MSGVYIKGIEMPEVGRVNMEVVKYRDRYFIGPCGKSKWFQLIPVPDHGRLIDEDTYKAEMKKRQDAVAEWRDDIKNGGGYGTELFYRVDSAVAGFSEAMLTLDEITAVIPADKEEIQ